MLYVLLINILACFVEGGLGFGGSLTFLGLSFLILGWDGALITDNILALINLSFVLFLYRKDLVKDNGRRRLFSPIVISFFPMIAGIILYFSVPLRLKFILLFLSIIIVLFFKKGFNIEIVNMLFAGFFIGLINSHAPFGYFYFSDSKKSKFVGLIALFGVLALSLKLFILLFVFKISFTLSFGEIFLLVIVGFPFTILGKLFFDRFSFKSRDNFVKYYFITLILIVLFFRFFINH